MPKIEKAPNGCILEEDFLNLLVKEYGFDKGAESTKADAQAVFDLLYDLTNWYDEDVFDFAQRPEDEAGAAAEAASAPVSSMSCLWEAPSSLELHSLSPAPARRAHSRGADLEG